MYRAYPSVYLSVGSIFVKAWGGV